MAYNFRWLAAYQTYLIAIRILAIGIIVSVRIYIGIPIIAASGTAHKLLVPAKFANKSVGINSYIKAPIPAPIIK